MSGEWPVRYSPPSARTRDWVCRAFGPGARIVSAIRLAGGITAAVDSFMVTSGSGARLVVLRRWAEPADAAQVERESRALQWDGRLDLPVPEVLAVDADGSDSGQPSILTSQLPGKPQLAHRGLDNRIDQLAAALAQIHRLPPELPDPFHGWYSPDDPLDWIEDRALARDAAVAAASAGGPESTVHGDFQHFNVLFSARELSGVVDWPGAGRGWPGIDVGHCRLNLAALYSVEAADRFAASYLRRADPPDAAAEVRALLHFDHSWPRFLPVQVDGQVPVDGAGMTGRVVELLRSTLSRVG